MNRYYFPGAQPTNSSQTQTPNFKIFTYFLKVICISYVQKEHQSKHPCLRKLKWKVTLWRHQKEWSKIVEYLTSIYAGSIQISTRHRHFYPKTKIRCLSYFTEFEKRYRFPWLSQMQLFHFVSWRDSWFVWFLFVCRTFLGFHLCRVID